MVDMSKNNNLEAEGVSLDDSQEWEEKLDDTIYEMDLNILDVSTAIKSYKREDVKYEVDSFLYKVICDIKTIQNELNKIGINVLTEYQEDLRRLIREHSRQFKFYKKMEEDAKNNSISNIYWGIKKEHKYAVRNLALLYKWSLEE